MTVTTRTAATPAATGMPPAQPRRTHYGPSLGGILFAFLIVMTLAGVLGGLVGVWMGGA